jgi:hypothetical protein
LLVIHWFLGPGYDIIDTAVQIHSELSFRELIDWLLLEVLKGEGLMSRIYTGEQGVVTWWGDEKKSGGENPRPWCIAGSPIRACHFYQNRQHYGHYILNVGFLRQRSPGAILKNRAKPVEENFSIARPNGPACVQKGIHAVF